MTEGTFDDIKWHVFIEQLNEFHEETDYNSIVRQEWEQKDEFYKQCLRSENTLKRFIENNPGITSVEAKKRIEYFISQKFGTCRGLPNKSDVSTILKGFTKDEIFKVCKVIKPTDLETLWNDSSYMFQKIENARLTRRELNKSIQELGSLVKRYEQSEHFPLAVLKPMREAFAFAKAYRDFLDAELGKSRYKNDGTEYRDLTRRNVWNRIIVNVVNVIREAQKLNYRVAGKSAYSYTAELLSVTYPWCWGKLDHDKATKMVRERYDRQ